MLDVTATVISVHAIRFYNSLWSCGGLTELQAAHEGKPASLREMSHGKLAEKLFDKKNLLRVGVRLPGET